MDKNEILAKLYDLDGPDVPCGPDWSEGYISALADIGAITEDVFNGVLDVIKTWRTK